MAEPTATLAELKTLTVLGANNAKGLKKLGGINALINKLG